MLEFDYATHGPLPWAVKRTNLIRLFWDGDNLVYTRFYNGDPSEPGISHVFDLAKDRNAWNVARNIHWGCSGRDQLSNPDLEEKVAKFLEAERP
jgi:hypothetical protein